VRGPYLLGPMSGRRPLRRGYHRRRSGLRRRAFAGPFQSDFTRTFGESPPPPVGASANAAPRTSPAGLTAHTDRSVAKIYILKSILIIFYLCVMVGLRAVGSFTRLRQGYGITTAPIGQPSAPSIYARLPSASSTYTRPPADTRRPIPHTGDDSRGS